MEPRSALLTALGISIAIHVSAGASFHVPGSGRPSVPDNAIFISSVSYTPPLPKSEPLPAPAKIEPEAADKKPAVAAPVPRKAYLQPPLPVRHEKPAPVKSARSIASSGYVRSDELAADPEKGKIFTSYFGLIKQKINDAVKRRYNGDGEGRVTVLFVLSESGKLQDVAILDGQTDADLAAKKLVLDGVKDAAPFGSFPAQLGTGRIAFNLTIFFEEA